MKLLYSLPFLGLGLSSVTLASSGFFYINHKHPLNPLSERQTQICGEGDTCADACGADYVQCGTSSLNCYNPTAGDTCCGASGYYCPSGEYCADSDGYCCTNDQDLGSCAASLGITLPSSTASATYIPSTTYIPTTTDVPTTIDVPTTTYNPGTTYIPNSIPTSGSVATSTYVPPTEPVGTSSGTSPAFTGAAIKMDVGVIGNLLAVGLGLAGVL